MKMFKEFKVLFKLFFSKVEPDLKALPIIKMQHFPLGGYEAMQWCGNLIDKSTDDVEVDDTIMTHEMIHYKQALAFGAWWKYYLAYMYEWLRLGWTAPSIYHCHPMEIEAYLHEDNPNYTTYKGKYKMYRMKHARRMYQMHKFNWMSYLKDRFKED